MKRCRRCNTDLPLDAFNANRSAPDGRQYVCRTCQLAVNREWAERNPEVRRAQQKRRYLREQEGGGRPSKRSAPDRFLAHHKVERALIRDPATAGKGRS